MKNPLSTLLLIILFSGIYAFKVNAQDTSLKPVEVGIAALPLFDFEEGYFGVVINSGFRFGVAEKLSVGPSLFLYAINDVEVNRVNSRIRAYGAVGTIRYTLLSAQKIKLFADGALGSGYVSYKSNVFDQNSVFADVGQNNGGLLIYSVGLGAKYMVSEKIGLDIAVPYITVENITNENIERSIYSGLGPNIGISYALR